MTSTLRYQPSEIVHALEEAGDFDFLTDLIDCFLADSTTRLDALRKAAGSRDAKRLSKEAHSLKGSAASMGLTALAVACQELDDTARTAPARDFTDAVERLGLALALDKECVAEFRDSVRQRAQGALSSAD